MDKYERIVKEVSEFLHTYLKAGYIRADSFSHKIHEQIDRFEQLFIIRFLLQEETKQFVKELPALIRNFKTTTVMKQQTNIAEVRGAIDWQETIRTRLNENYADKLTFVTIENIRSYDIPENLVLKRLLIILYNELYDNDYVQGFYDRDWFQEWKVFKKNVATILRKNIYLQRVPNIHISNRMLNNTMKHRNPLYRKSALLLAQYYRFMHGQYDEDELEQLLRETFILPKEEDVLFELYWVIQLIKHNTKTSTLHLIDGRDNLVASWDRGEYEYAIYHDSTGPKELTFQTHLSELQNSNNIYTEKLYTSFQLVNEYREKYFNRNKQNVFRDGRPDIIITVRQKKTDKLVKLIIGEVKNTKRISYVITGLRELLDYIHLVKRDNEYAQGEVSVQGLLCTDKIEWNENSSEQELVQIVTPTFKKGLKL